MMPRIFRRAFDTWRERRRSPLFLEPVLNCGANLRARPRLRAFQLDRLRGLPGTNPSIVHTAAWTVEGDGALRTGVYR